MFPGYSASMDRLSPLQEAIGHLCNEFAKLETFLGCAVGFMANPSDARTGLILVAQTSFKVRLAAFESLYAERAQPGFDDAPLEVFLTEIRQLEERRNVLIHSFYWPGPVGSQTATRIKFTPKDH